MSDKTLAEQIVEEAQYVEASFDTMIERVRRMIESMQECPHTWGDENPNQTPI